MQVIYAGAEDPPPPNNTGFYDRNKGNLCQQCINSLIYIIATFPSTFI